MAFGIDTCFVKKGTIVGSAAPLDEFQKGVTDTYRTLLLSEDGSIKAVIAKNIPPKQLANEMLAANIASLLHLPIPPAFIASISDDWCSNILTKNSDGGGLVFASTDVKAPAIAQTICSNSIQFVVNKLVAESWLGDLYGFDSWIVNSDRHNNNMLMSPDGIWIIDHERSFTGPDWIVSGLIANKEYYNCLSAWVTPHLQEAVRRRLASSIDHLIERIREIDVVGVCSNELTSALVDNTELVALAEFLVARVNFVSGAACAALDVKRII